MDENKLEFKWDEELALMYAEYYHRNKIKCAFNEDALNKRIDELALMEEGFNIGKSGKYDTFYQYKKEQSKLNSNKDWVIVSQEGDLNDLSDYFNTGSIGKNYKIKSVRRLSDNEVFSLGDKVDYKWGDNDDFEQFETGVITKISRSFDNKNEIIFEIKVGDEEYANKFLRNIRKAAKQKLFTTEDGKDIYEGDDVWFVGKKTLIKGYVEKAKQYTSCFFDNYIYFSTEAAAKDYILMHKPCLSLDDLLSVWADGDMYKKNKEYYADAPLFLNFKRLVNKKLNDSNR